MYVLTLRKLVRYSWRSLRALGKSDFRIDRPRIILRHEASLRKFSGSSACMRSVGFLKGFLSSSVACPSAMRLRRSVSFCSYLCIFLSYSACASGWNSFQINGIYTENVSLDALTQGLRQRSYHKRAIYKDKRLVLVRRQRATCWVTNLLWEATDPGWHFELKDH